MHGLGQDRLELKSSLSGEMKMSLAGNEGQVPLSSQSRPHELPAVPKHHHRWLLAGYGAFAALLFVAFLTASFPYADTIAALAAPLRIKVVFQRQEMNFPIGTRLEDVRLISTASQRSLLQSPEVRVSPGLFWFLLGRPHLRIRAQMFGGALEATVQQSSPATLVNFDLQSLDLAHMSMTLGELMEAAGDEEVYPPAQLGLGLKGELSGRGSAQLMGPDIIAGRGNMIFFGRDVEAAIVNGLPPLDLGTVRGKVILEQGVAILQDVRAAGADGELGVNGEIELAPNIARSVMQLTVALTPSRKGRAAFGFFLNMLPHAPNDGPYHVQGALMSPSVS
jgi:type II secretion system protein N